MEINLKAGDKIIGFVDTNKFIKYINENRGKEVSLNIERGKEKINFNVVPRINPPVGEGSLGVGLVDAGLPKKIRLQVFGKGLKLQLSLLKIFFGAR